MEGPGGLLGMRIGGLPLVAIVGAGAGLIALWFGISSRKAAPKSGADMLSPSSAEAFTALQQDQEDLGNAISALAQQNASAFADEHQLLASTSGQLVLGVSQSQQMTDWIGSHYPDYQHAYNQVMGLPQTDAKDTLAVPSSSAPK